MVAAVRAMVEAPERRRPPPSACAREWFFKSHFYQDPVQPGSLGIDAMLQALQVFMIEADMGRGLGAPGHPKR